MKLFNILFLFFTFNNFGYSQSEALGKIHTSEIIFLNDSHLKSTIKRIMTKDSLCQTKSVQWSIEVLKNDMILITKYSLGNLIASQGITNIYTTVIDDKFLFLSSKENINSVFIKSGYSVDLTSFIDKGNFSTIDYSFWVIQKKDGKNYKIIKEKKYACNN
ncbi:hypothetical protein [Flavobacterium hibernum]|uniref:Uncharacterized protein n=1 Tax=Flavobacterium hibernum TaxID=37752 RepID=A0A0D0EZQ2_9FLAO|nr:hypothetical protein [Flavobacterium hibernum]KIO52866.1 hypothetical protein IW18_10030 [Flavobacterium hibernum]OXA88507.1 hypothetical protein B0A73_07440 [Flavobacterium hibernum]STO15365.1 Uncharacterised protein [Flavobacterium hibernum]